MDDLISRQAAVEAILHNQSVFEQFRDEDPVDRFAIAVIDNDAQTIAQLPSAQRWIPVTERMPEAFKKVLVFWWEHSEPMIDTAFWQKDAKRFEGHHWVGMEDKVTHWMPQPLPPKEEAERV